MSRTARRLLAFYIATIMVLLGTPGVATIVRALRKQKITHEIPIPPFRAQAWLDGSYQKSCETWFAENFPMRNFYVRTSNQINFSVFHEITFKNRTRIIMGRNNSLFRTVYIDSYYGRGAMSPEVIEKFATDLRKLQDRLQSRGITFLFFITPSKPSIYPEDIPEYMKSPSGEPRPSNYDLLVPQLAKHGVETLDGRALFRSMKETSPYPLFPRSGFHWNYYSSVRAVQELTSRLEVIMGKRLNHLHFDRVRTQREPIGSDGDAAQLAYLWSPSVFWGSNPYPDLSREAVPGAVVPNVLLVGDSFLDLPRHWLVDYGIVDGRSYHNWYFLGHVDDPEREILGRDVVILGMNEALLHWRGFGLIETVLTGTFHTMNWHPD